MSKQTEGNMSKKFNVRLDENMADLVDKLIKKKGARNLSEYIRGLILIDAFDEFGPSNVVPGVEIPKWLNERFVFTVKKK